MSLLVTVLRNSMMRSEAAAMVQRIRVVKAIVVVENLNKWERDIDLQKPLDAVRRVEQY